MGKQYYILKEILYHSETFLQHVTEEHEKERNILLAENQRLKKELEMPDVSLIYS